MATLARETKNVQNPALGAMILWRFSAGYTAGSTRGEHVPLPLLFLVLPVILRQDTAQLIAKTRKASGLRAFVNKFNETQTSKNDLISAIHPSAMRLRELTSKSLALAISASLLKIDKETSKVIRLSATSPKAGVAESVKDLLNASEKLGHWCSQITLHEISIVLKVGL